MTTSRRHGATRLMWYVLPICVVGIAVAIYATATSDPDVSQVGSVQVVGSETVRPVIAACAEEFMTKNPQADVVVQGGGSSDGIAALLHGIVDIGMVSRELSERERTYATTQGIDVAMFALGLDGITIIVHRDNPISDFSLDQVRDMFIGKVTSWHVLGGRNTEIQTLARAEGSGTAALFGERVLAGAPYGSTVRQLQTNEAIVHEVAASPDAIGYTSLGALRTARDDVKVIALRPNSRAAPVSPSLETVRSKSYPLVRTLYLSVAGNPAGIVKSFVEFCTIGTGGALVQSAGYVGIGSGIP